tara:strand:- start:1722 stop:2276 length:555 start_codon:yes stop_codon:yes gene_type:complete
MINQDSSQRLKSWVLRNIDLIKSQPNSKPKGHKGLVLGLQDLQKKDLKEVLNAHSFPYNDLKHIEEDLINTYKIPTKKYAESGIMVIYSEKGYKCKWHTDTTDNLDEYTTRLNVLISKPKDGGEPIIKKNNVKETIPVTTNEPWICVAGKYEHSTVKTKSDEPRILLSFGYNVNKKILENLGYI